MTSVNNSRMPCVSITNNFNVNVPVNKTDPYSTCHRLEHLWQILWMRFYIYFSISPGNYTHRTSKFTTSLSTLLTNFAAAESLKNFPWKQCPLPSSKETATCLYLKPQYSSTLHFNIILHPSLDLLNGLIPTGSPTTILYAFLVWFERAACPAHPIVIDSDILRTTKYGALKKLSPVSWYLISPRFKCSPQQNFPFYLHYAHGDERTDHISLFLNPWISIYQRSFVSLRERHFVIPQATSATWFVWYLTPAPL